MPQGTRPKVVAAYFLGSLGFWASLSLWQIKYHGLLLSDQSTKVVSLLISGQRQRQLQASTVGRPWVGFPWL